VTDFKLIQFDRFDTPSHGDVNLKDIMATNKIDYLDPTLIRHGRIECKIEFLLPVPWLMWKRDTYGYVASRGFKKKKIKHTRSIFF